MRHDRRQRPRTRGARPSLVLVAIGLLAQPLTVRADTGLATFAGLGTQGGSASYAAGINDGGQVVGYAYFGDYTVTAAFLVSGGTTTALTGLGGRQAYANAINDAGQVVGEARTADEAQLHAVAFVGGVAQDIGPPFAVLGSTATAINSSGDVAGYARPAAGRFSAFVATGGGVVQLGALVAGGLDSYATGINDSGQVVGFADAVEAACGNCYSHAFVYSQGAMQDLGTLGGSSANSYAVAISHGGQIVGYSDVGDGTSAHAFSFSQGIMSDLGTLGGANSQAAALNAHGWIVGNADTADGVTHAAIWQAGTAYDLNAAAPAGWTLTYAAGINARGQIVGTGTHDGHDEAFVLTPNATWRGASGRWDDSGSWSLGAFGALGQTPDALHDVVVVPPASATVLGSASASVHSLAVVGNAGSIVTFDLNAGFTSAGNGTTIGANAVLTGGGQLDGSLSVAAGGVLQVSGGQSMLLTGGPVTIQGVARVYGGGGAANLSATAPVTVASGGQMNLQGANLDLRAGLVVNGQLNAGASGNNVAAAVTLAPAGKVVLSGNSATSFYDPVEVQGGAEFRVSAGASATFFGAVTERTGALFTGTGGKYYEGGLSIGASPGLGTDEGNVSFGDSNLYLAEIGGASGCTAACAGDGALKNSSYDKYVVAGRLTLGGTLEVVSWNGFVAQAGQSFDLLDWGSSSGTFATVDSSGLQLAAGAALDLSKLYTRGEIDVVAVPEPQTWALMAGGLLALVVRQRRRAAAVPDLA